MANGGDGGTRRAGRRPVRGRVIVATDATVDLTVPLVFAPGTEECPIEYAFNRGSHAGANVSLTIRDAAGAVVYENRLLGLAADRRETYRWNGRDTAGALVTPHKSPYRVTLAIDAAVSMARDVRVEVSSIALWTAESPDIVMNDPAHKIGVVATVKLRKTDGTEVLPELPVRIKWTFTDPAPANTAKGDSFAHAPPQRLGKAGDAAALHWEQHPDCAASSGSDDGYKQNAWADSLIAAPDKGKAKVFFKPSGVGGDSFVLQANVFKHDGTTLLIRKESPTLTVKRRLRFTPKNMVGQNHFAAHGTTAKIGRYYDASTYVRYELGGSTALAANVSVTYFGLWDHATTSQKSWATEKAKTAAETPTAAEIAAAGGAAGAARTAARAAITAKAQAWHDRIKSGYDASLSSWTSDAGIVAQDVVAVDLYHPKYDADSPNADARTSEWSGMPWLRITNEDGASVHPDSRWTNVQGFAWGGIAFIYGRMSAARTEVVIAHEAGHASKQQFKRDQFGGGDHSAAAGLMDPTGSRSSFTAREKKVLRGIVP